MESGEHRSMSIDRLGATRYPIVRPSVRPVLLAVTLVFAAAITGCVSADSSDERAGLVWAPCADQGVGPEQDCATLSVPLDHDDPELGKLELAVRRRPAQSEDRIGTLIWLDGGPGFRSTLRIKSGHFSEALLDRFDLVSWDPRGTSGSSAIDCPTDDITLFQVDPTPETEAEVEVNEQLVESWAGPCRQAFVDLLPRIGTYETARDLEVLRQALDESEVSLLAGSYGTRVAVVYGTLYPDHARAMVLDGYDDPNVSLIDHGLRLAGAFEDQLTAVLDDCANDSACPFYFDGDPYSALDRLFDRLDEHPLSGPDADSPEITEAAARWVVVQYLYFERERRQLLRALAGASEGDGSGMSALMQRAIDANRSGGITPGDNLGIRCADRAGYWEAYSASDKEAFAAELARIAPRMGPSFGPVSINAARYNGNCEIQPLQQSKLPATMNSAGSGPILILAATGDTATPYDAALAAVDDLDDAHLVTIEADQHTSFFTAVDIPGTSSSECILNAVHDLLIELTVPRQGITCA